MTKSSSSGTPSKGRPLTPTPTQLPGSPIRFEWLKDCGVDFTYYGNPSPEHYMTEQNGGASPFWTLTGTVARTSF